MSREKRKSPSSSSSDFLKSEKGRLEAQRLGRQAAADAFASLERSTKKKKNGQNLHSFELINYPDIKEHSANEKWPWSDFVTTVVEHPNKIVALSDNCLVRKLFQTNMFPLQTNLLDRKARETMQTYQESTFSVMATLPLFVSIPNMLTSPIIMLQGSEPANDEIYYANFQIKRFNDEMAQKRELYCQAHECEPHVYYQTEEARSYLHQAMKMAEFICRKQIQINQAQVNVWSPYMSSREILGRLLSSQHLIKTTMGFSSHDEERAKLIYKRLEVCDKILEQEIISLNNRYASFDEMVEVAKQVASCGYIYDWKKAPPFSWIARVMFRYTLEMIHFLEKWHVWMCCNADEDTLAYLRTPFVTWTDKIQQSEIEECFEHQKHCFQLRKNFFGKAWKEYPLRDDDGFVYDAENSIVIPKVLTKEMAMMSINALAYFTAKQLKLNRFPRSNLNINNPWKFFGDFRLWVPGNHGLVSVYDL